MILFIRNIPANTLRDELYAFVAPTLKSKFFFRAAYGRILKTEILAMRDKHTNIKEYHGLIHLDSAAAGERAIRLLKGKRFKNKLVFVREYKKRHWHNDRRHKQKNVPKEILDRRIHDRRRGEHLEVIEGVSLVFQAQEGFARKYKS